MSSTTTDDVENQLTFFAAVLKASRCGISGLADLMRCISSLSKLHKLKHIHHYSNFFHSTIKLLTVTEPQKALIVLRFSTSSSCSSTS